MTRIEISSGKLNLVPEYLDAIIDAIQTHGETLSSIKNQCLSIAKSTCDLQDVEDILDKSTKEQKEAIKAFKDIKHDCEVFAQNAANTDEKAANRIDEKFETLYTEKPHLKPDCEKGAFERLKDAICSVAEWAKENWDEILKVAGTVLIIGVCIAAVVVSGGTAGGLLGALAVGALSGALFSAATAGGLAALYGASPSEIIDAVFGGTFGGAVTGAIFGGTGYAALKFGVRFGRAYKAAKSRNAFLRSDVKAITSMSKNQLKNDLPKGWKHYDNNGRIHVKDTYKNTRVRVDPPDRTTNYQHMHVYDNKRNLLDIKGNIVDKKDPAGHIKWGG